MDGKKQKQIWNGRLMNEEDESEMSFKADTRVYEVLRLINFVPLFWDDHWKRLLHSCLMMACHLEAQSDELLEEVVSLAKANHVTEGNVMITIFIGSEKPGILVRFIPHVYPTALQYEKGVEVALLHAERMNPAAKVVQSDVRWAANQIIAEKGVYEVLLLNRNNELTEGSRSNLLVISNHQLYTAPLKHVLRGITLGKVIELCSEQNYPLHFESFTLDRLKQADALFLTGTSPKILPIAGLGQLKFDVNHPVLRTLMKEYDRLIESEVQK